MCVWKRADAYECVISDHVLECEALPLSDHEAYHGGAPWWGASSSSVNPGSSLTELDCVGVGELDQVGCTVSQV